MWDRITNHFKDDEEIQSTAIWIARQPESETLQRIC
jgi:hypothetical protein